MMRRILSYLLAAAIFAGAAAVPALADGGIYVNNGAQLDQALKDSYAVGSGGDIGVIGSDEVYVMTGSGLEQISGGAIKPSTGEGGGGLRYTDGQVSIRSDKVKIGLKYYFSSSRNSSVQSANLQNEVGSGYEFGYYDADRVFHKVGQTSQTKLTMVKDTNVSMSFGTIGCYHILLGGSYASFEEASAAAAKYSDGFPAYYNGTYYALAGHYTSSADAQSAISSRGISGTAYTASNRCVAVTVTGTDQFLFEFDCGTDHSLAVHPLSTGAAAVTWFAGYKYPGDFEYTRLNGGDLTVINIVGMEDYIKGVVATEMSEKWPLEALKAQAVCARSYSASYIKRSVYFYSCGFDVTNDTYCQAYTGFNRVGDNIIAAVNATANQYLTCNGSICSALYFSSDGGGTESSYNVNGTEVEYLQGVDDPYEAAAASMNGYSSWKVTLRPTQVSSKLSAYGMASVTAITPTYSDTGNVIELKFTDANGKTCTISRGQCRTVMGLNSIHYTVTKNSDGNFVFEGGGWGHNVGMSQFGAYAMAQYYGMDYQDILGYYYTNVGLSRGVVA